MSLLYLYHFSVGEAHACLQTKTDGQISSHNPPITNTKKVEVDFQNTFVRNFDFARAYIDGYICNHLCNHTTILLQS